MAKAVSRVSRNGGADTLALLVAFVLFCFTLGSCKKNDIAGRGTDGPATVSLPEFPHPSKLPPPKPPSPYATMADLSNYVKTTDLSNYTSINLSDVGPQPPLRLIASERHSNVNDFGRALFQRYKAIPSITPYDRIVITGRTRLITEALNTNSTNILNFKNLSNNGYLLKDGYTDYMSATINPVSSSDSDNGRGYAWICATIDPNIFFIGARGCAYTEKISFYISYHLEGYAENPL